MGGCVSSRSVRIGEGAAAFCAIDRHAHASDGPPATAVVVLNAWTNARPHQLDVCESDACVRDVVRAWCLHMQMPGTQGGMSALVRELQLRWERGDPYVSINCHHAQHTVNMLVDFRALRPSD
jgi:hypothetical protein